MMEILESSFHGVLGAEARWYGIYGIYGRCNVQPRIVLLLLCGACLELFVEQVVSVRIWKECYSWLLTSAVGLEAISTDTHGACVPSLLEIVC
jgi:hypothetical protein